MAKPARKTNVADSPRTDARAMPMKPISAAPAPAANNWRVTAGIIAVLAALAFIAFSPVLFCDFVNYDDGVLITANPHVAGGLSEEGLTWAWTTMSVGYPQPITLTSFMIDASLYGVDHPAGFHATNLVLHVANVLLLYLLLARATGARWRSALVAALFAVHPLQVESVAWVTERKGLLAMLFALLALLAYLRYARMHGEPTRARIAMYAVVAILFAASLLCKPVFLPLPALLLVADWWPLERLARKIRLPGGGAENASAVEPTAIPAITGRAVFMRRVGFLIVEKLPLLAIALGVAVLGMIGQSAHGSAVGAGDSSLANRIAGAMIVYGRSLVKLIDCARLAIPYPEPRAWPAMHAMAAASLLIVITVFAIHRRRQAPWLLAGWLWFLAMLAPVCGIINFGGHLFADRYSYASAIGLAVMFAWSMPVDRAMQGVPRRMMVAITAITLAACTILSIRQSLFWRNSFVLFDHTRAVTGDNVTADVLLGNAYLNRGQPGDADLALAYCTRAMKIDSSNQAAHKNAGVALLQLGRLDEAIANFQSAADFNPNTADGVAALDGWANALVAQNRLPEAIELYRRALSVPGGISADVRANLGRALGMQGKIDDAIAELKQSIDEDPRRADSWRHLGTALMAKGAAADALGCFKKSLELNANSPEAWYGAGTAYMATGQFDLAADAFQQALRLRPGYPLALRQLQMLHPR